METEKKPRRRRLRRIVLALGVVILTPPALFVLNGTVLSYGETPLVVTTDAPAGSIEAADELRCVGQLAPLTALRGSRCWPGISPRASRTAAG